MGNNQGDKVPAGLCTGPRKILGKIPGKNINKKLEKIPNNFWEFFPVKKKDTLGPGIYLPTVRAW